MRVKNTTNIPDKLIREIIAFTRPSGISNFDVMVKNGEYLAGRAYTQGSRYHATRDKFIVCRVPEKGYPKKFSTYQYVHLKGKRYYHSNRIEAVVYLMAHELRHLWQAKSKNKSGYAFGSRGRFSEIDTESYAINKLRQWRNKNNS